MGYYSDVALVLTPNGSRELSLRLENISSNEKLCESVSMLFKNAHESYTNDSGAKAWIWNGIKWYADFPKEFPEVEFVENLITDLNEEDYYFIRVGEDFDDNEIRGLWIDNPFCIYLSRGIVADC